LASAIGHCRDRRGTRRVPAPLCRTTLLALALVSLTACSNGGSAPDPKLGVAASPRVTTGNAVPKGGGIYKVGKPYQVAGRWYVPREVEHYDQSGIASWYGAAFHGRRTANGEIYDMNALTAGHPTLPMPSYAYVTNLNNGRTILVRINDRGPYVNDRRIDLSRRSAAELGYSRHGLARVRVRYAGRAPLDGNDAAERRHLASQPWYRGNLDVARSETSDISTGAIADPETTASWSLAAYRQRLLSASRQGSGPVALGGPEAVAADIGPFASRAEAARMRHEMRDPGAVVIEGAQRSAEASYFVRLGPPVSTAGARVGLRQ
jgi:rare lipoprotein A